MKHDDADMPIKTLCCAGKCNKPMTHRAVSPSGRTKAPLCEEHAMDMSILPNWNRVRDVPKPENKKIKFREFL